MVRGRYRWLIRLALVLLISGLGLVSANRERARHQLVVENHAGQPITQLRIQVGDQKASFNEVADGNTVIAPFEVKGEDKRL